MRKNGRPANTARCPGPHTENPGWRRLDRYLCGGCWAQLPRETRDLLRKGVPAGASARRWHYAKQQLTAGTPLNEIRVDTVPIQDLYPPSWPELAEHNREVSS